MMYIAEREKINTNFIYLQSISKGCYTKVKMSPLDRKRHTLENVTMSIKEANRLNVMNQVV
ncbi:MAG: hypothetical protein KR126chlam2_00139 [Chlamydiae bacterium]|nr:hypothetical protein [Chlamydiota bacterium]